MKVVLPAGAIAQERHRLDPARIIETAENLARDVGERLPGSSLAGLAVVLSQIAHATDEPPGRPVDLSAPSGLFPCWQSA